MSLIRDIVAVYKQNADTKKALRLLNKQEWSIEFLTSLLVRASKIRGQELEMTISDKSGRTVTVSTVDKNETADNIETDIFNHIDDDIKIQQFIETMRRKKDT